MATAARAPGGLLGFLRAALAPVFTARMVVPVLLLTLLLTASNIVIAHNVPPEGMQPGAAFAVTAFVRVVGLLVLAVAILRLLNDSPRRTWMPDAGFWLYTLTFFLVIALSTAGRMVIGSGDAIVGFLLVNAVVTILTAPLAAWFVALAVARPVPWSPARWMRAMPSWLPHFIFWALLVTVPLGALHAYIDLHLLEGAGDLFWPLALFDGPLSAVMAVAGLALGSEAYRRVARS